MGDELPFNFNLILPVGTQVVTRVEIKDSADEAYRPCGAVGVIVRAPADNTHAYRVQFPDGGCASLRRAELTVRKHWQKEPLEQAAGLVNFQLDDYVIYRCVVGSRAFGLEENWSDTDRRGIYLPPASMHWSIYGVPEQLENNKTQECYWELQKFIILALKANPNVLECLYTPMVEKVTSVAEELLAMRSIFVSQLVYQTYNGYVMSQFKKLEQDLRTKGTVKWKHAMHLIRLLLSGITVLKEGFVPVRIEGYREQLLAIRHGKVAWEEVNAWRLSLHKDFDAAFTNTDLPERPDYEMANAFLIKARRCMV